MEGNFKKWINRINSKQDVLTEDNVGQFMDLELPTKLTPTSGDTVLARDILTNKAVEIPIESLGGGGGGDLSNYYTKTETYSKTEVDDIIADIPVVDTSNLVPYTGANKDVNIGNYYFESSLGFKQTGGDSTQYLMADGSTSTLPADLIRGTGTIGRITRYSATGVIGNSVIYDDGANVGVGTTSPSRKLDVNGDGRFQTNLTIGLTTNNNGTKTVFNGSTVGRSFQIANNWNVGGSFEITPSTTTAGSTFTTPALVVNGTTSNVGIGTTLPSEKLDVNGNVKATGFIVANGTANKALTANGGVFDLNTKADLEGGKVPASQLPSYVDDVLEFANLASFPATGESGKIYIAIDTNLTYRWGGSSYVVMSSSLALGETSSTAYRGDRGKIAYDHSQTTGNPHGTTKTDIGLGNVPNIDATNPTNIVQTSSYRFVTDSEKTNLSTAYTHSQATGNPHGTELEQLSDVSGDATTIIDDDEILKKESGGLWKKITFANFKNWFTTELAKKINIGLDTVFNFKNISAMTLTDFRSITPDIETIYFTEEQNSTGWQQVRYNGLGITIPATTETLVSLTNENFIELDSDSTFNLIDVANTKINGIFEKDFVIIKFNAGVVTPATANQWFKVILKINGVQTAVSPVFYLTETSGTVEQIAYDFSLNVTPEMVANGATLHIKTSTNLTFNNPAISVARVHKSTNANL